MSTQNPIALSWQRGKLVKKLAILNAGLKTKQGFNLPLRKAKQCFCDLTGRTHVPFFKDLSLKELESLDTQFTIENVQKWIEAQGRMTVVCVICGRPLTDPESRARGTGPVCDGRTRAGREHLELQLEDLE